MHSTTLNVKPVAAIDGVRELHIGHAIVRRAVFVVCREAVREMKRLMVEARTEVQAISPYRMIAGVGADIANVKRIEDALFGMATVSCIESLREDEVAGIRNSGNNNVLKRFAAKLVSQGLGHRHRRGPRLAWHRRANDARGKAADCRERSHQTGNWQREPCPAHITLTDETDHALAFVVLETAMSLNLPWAGDDRWSVWN